MAVNPVQFLVASNASILDGTKTITISGGVNASRVFSGTAVFLGGSDNPAEAVSGTAPDGSGISTITLRNNWTQGDISNQSLVAFNTNEGLAEAISNVREIVSNVSAIEDLATQGLIKRINDNEYEVVSTSALGEALVGASDASSARTVLGLGSAATKDVVTAFDDTDNGKVLQSFGSIGYLGLGSTTAPTTNDANTVVKSGIYAGSGGSATNFPGSTAFAPYLAMRRLSSQDTISTFHISGAGGQPVEAWIRRSTDGGVNWFEGELYHSGNSVNPLTYGLSLVTNNGMRDSAGSIVNDLNLSSQPNQFFVFDSATANRPITNQGLTIPNGVGITMSRDANIWGQLTISRSGASLGETVIRAKDGTNVKERTVFDSGNTNFNEFGGNATNDVIAVGEAVTSTVARFYFPLQSKNPVNSFTLIDTVNILKGSATIATGLTAGSITLSGLTSSKIAVLDITTSGLTVGDLSNLRTNTASASIQFNV